MIFLQSSKRWLGFSGWNGGKERKGELLLHLKGRSARLMDSKGQNNANLSPKPCLVSPGGIRQGEFLKSLWPFGPKLHHSSVSAGSEKILIYTLSRGIEEIRILESLESTQEIRWGLSLPERYSTIKKIIQLVEWPLGDLDTKEPHLRIFKEITLNTHSQDRPWAGKSLLPALTCLLRSRWHWSPDYAQHS